MLVAFIGGFLCGVALLVAGGFLSAVTRIVKEQRATEARKRQAVNAVVQGFMDGLKIAAASRVGPKPSPPVSIPEPPSLVGKVH